MDDEARLFSLKYGLRSCLRLNFGYTGLSELGILAEKSESFVLMFSSFKCDYCKGSGSPEKPKEQACPRCNSTAYYQLWEDDFKRNNIPLPNKPKTEAYHRLQCFHDNDVKSDSKIPDLLPYVSDDEPPKLETVSDMRTMLDTKWEELNELDSNESLTASDDQYLENQYEPKPEEIRDYERQENCGRLDPDAWELYQEAERRGKDPNKAVYDFYAGNPPEWV